MIINCKEIAQKWKNECKGIPASLAIIQVGDNPASNSYIKGKLKDCEEIGFKSTLYKFDDDVDEETVLNLINELNLDDTVNGIIVQLPLPKHLDETKITRAVSIDKDVDGFIKKSDFTPCTPLGVVTLLEEINYDVSGKFIVVLGRSEFIGKEIARLLLRKNATIAICHSRTPMKTRDKLLRMADVTVSAVGQPDLFSWQDLKKGSIVIDVGINRKDGHLCGDFVPSPDIDYLDYTSVPGGIGLLTRAMLLKNTAKAYKKQNKKTMDS